jgi:hypothetical protein
MSSLVSRQLIVWRSSLAESITPISGVFSFEVLETLMDPQTLQFLAEKSLNASSERDSLTSGFLSGMRFVDANRPKTLFFLKCFENANEPFTFDFNMLSDAIQQLELHTDINLTYRRVTYLADVGRGPELPLLILERLPFARGYAFEIQERGAVTESLLRGDFRISDKARVAHQHYSTGMALLAGEDSVSGLIDAAFMQFYLSMEAILDSHKASEAVQNGHTFFSDDFDTSVETIVLHVYKARNKFFGHAHPKYLKGILDADTAYDIAKQALVARWCARRVLELELGCTLAKREMQLSSRPSGGVTFSGDAQTLLREFALPV